MKVDIYKPTDNDSLSVMELDLYNLIMSYRADNGLDAIQLSNSLTLTAGRHAVDTYYNIWGENLALPADANLHSWSDAPYYSDHRAASVMWDAPERLGTPYTSNGYEISASGYGTIEKALDGWKSSSGHNAVILNTGIWTNRDWTSIGVGIEHHDDKRVYHVWFGDAVDPAGIPDVRGDSTADKMTGTKFGDRLFGLDGHDTILAGNGDDTVDGGAGNDSVEGGDGTDTYVVALNRADAVVEKTATGYQVVSSQGTDTLKSTEFIQFNDQKLDLSTVTPAKPATANADQLGGTTGNDTVDMLGGNDTYTSVGGKDIVLGNEGDDTAHLRNVDGSSQPIFAGHFDGGTGKDELLLDKAFADYNVVKNGEIFKFYDKSHSDVAGLGRLVATAKDIEMFEGMDLSTQKYTSNFNARTTKAEGTAPTDMSSIRDYDGNDLGQAAGWKNIGVADVQFDDDAEFIYINRDLGRWATVGPDANGAVDFADHGKGGDTRVVGIYIDPEVEAGRTVKFSEFDSQQRFQNDLRIDNLTVIDAFDFDGDGDQEVYFKVNDGTAYLRALMHSDGNIQYANYQSAQQVQDYLTSLNYDQSVLDTILI